MHKEFLLIKMIISYFSNFTTKSHYMTCHLRTSLFIIALIYPMLHKKDIPMTHPESMSLF